MSIIEHFKHQLADMERQLKGNASERILIEVAGLDVMQLVHDPNDDVLIIAGYDENDNRSIVIMAAAYLQFKLTFAKTVKAQREMGFKIEQSGNKLYEQTTEKA